MNHWMWLVSLIGILSTAVVYAKIVSVFVNGLAVRPSYT